MTYSLDSSVATPWVQVVANIGDESYDFSLLDTISFWAKGDGRIKICVAYFNKPNTYRGVNTFLTISNTWTLYKVVPANFENSTNISGWDELKTMVNRVIFNGITGGSEFWLDDIRMIGLTFDDLVKDQ